MAQLINKGGFRERANRSRKYQQSENEVTTLPPSQYQPHSKETATSTNPESPDPANSKDQT
ncbi:hypothetical protein ACMUMS_13165 [Acinetobacter courvalinii]|uniref:hypothetical protein n=1 Tax=Acinetobacter courvalinii TaxID=280147 RepID=UPI003A8B1159